MVLALLKLKKCGFFLLVTLVGAALVTFKSRAKLLLQSDSEVYSYVSRGN